MVQHPGSWMEPADPPAGHCPDCPTACSPRLFSGFLRFPGRERIPKLPEAVQLVDEWKVSEWIQKTMTDMLA